MEEERGGPGVQPSVRIRRAGCRRNGQTGPGVEDRPGTIPLCGWIRAGDTVSTEKQKLRPYSNTAATISLQQSDSNISI